MSQYPTRVTNATELHQWIKALVDATPEWNAIAIDMDAFIIDFASAQRELYKPCSRPTPVHSLAEAYKRLWGPPLNMKYIDYREKLEEFFNVNTRTGAEDMQQYDLNDVNLQTDDLTPVKYGYKIHGLSTANGEKRSANTSKFYRTLREAERAAESLLRSHQASGCDSLVIYKAIKMIGYSQPPLASSFVQCEDE